MREGARDKGKEGRGRKVKVSEQAVIEHLTCALCYAKKIPFFYNARWYRHLSF